MAKSTSCEVVLVRHAHSTANLKGILAGRDNRVALSPRGRQEAIELAPVLAKMEFEGIYSSPLRRCKETLVPYLQGRSEQLHLVDDLIEMEYGSWSGKALSTLSRHDLWKSIQSRPSTVRFPDGESFGEMSLRANQAVINLAAGKSRILILSHGDVIKSIVAFHLGLSLDQFQRISIDPASITRIQIPSSQVIQVNSTGHLSELGTSKRVQRDRFQLGGGSGKL
jgi:probable phosphoglycerate mutase